MYETEANHRLEPATQIPEREFVAFQALKNTILSRTLLPWSEHCTECAWPTCYTTCDLYSPRDDGRCRRFVDGMVRIDAPETVNGYLIKVRFKRWGKLWSPGVLKMQTAEEAARRERRDYQVGSILCQIALPEPMKRFAITKRYSFKKRVATRSGEQQAQSTSFVMECFNPAPSVVSLTLTVRSFDPARTIPYQKRVELAPGFTCLRVPTREIEARVNLRERFGIEIVPNETEDGTTLYFGLMDFVEEVRSAVPSRAMVKCVVWDLDNTLWDGVLVEDGPQNLRLKPGILEVIRNLDDRGILQSVASKNNPDETMQLLRDLQIAEYFLHPQICWTPKSTSIQRIAKLLNIGEDSLLFVDDSAFERSEVEMVCPETETLDALEYLSIPQLARCAVIATDESRVRRKMYQVEQQRQAGAEAFQDDYHAFLRSCDIEVTLTGLTEENLERVHELTQRTNQMNFSGNRYDRAMLRAIESDETLDTFVISCTDRFGSYGIVGFGVVDRREPRLTDLMFSCRVQAKRVEHAFLAHVLSKYRALAPVDFYASYKKTPRNAPSGKVFEDIGMREREVRAGVTDLVMPKDAPIPEDGLIRVVEQTGEQIQEQVGEQRESVAENAR